ncbi:MAG TPA: kynureninase [Acidimicrobiales bacterium]|nr:kynureninase [Acidimicrobiales bacterium]
MTNRDDCLARDRADTLAPLRELFTLNEAEVYLDGNSLGPVSSRVGERVREVIEEQWATGLVRNWGEWWDWPTRIGDRVARLVGAHADEVVVADTLTIAIAKLMGAALDQRPDRHVVLTDAANFHSDLYIIEEMAARSRRPITVKTIDRNALAEHLNEEVALVEFTHVDYRTGEMLDLAGITQQVHEAGALMLWDFAHSTGAVPLDVEGADVDFAAGCGYKYLNGGPGSPAFMYVRSKWQGVVRNPLPGWLGHARPFDFEMTYEAANGVRAFVTSSPSIVGMAALDGALDVFDRTSMAELRQKSLALTDLFIELVESRLPGVFDIVTPREHERRGSQVALRHHEAYGIVQAMIARGVIGDFRAPDIARFGFAPLYLRYVDVFDAVDRLGEVMESHAYEDPTYRVRNAVT